MFIFWASMVIRHFQPLRLHELVMCRWRNTLGGEIELEGGADPDLALDADVTSSDADELQLAVSAINDAAQKKL